jgi:hypothetical protein
MRERSRPVDDSKMMGKLGWKRPRTGSGRAPIGVPESLVPAASSGAENTLLSAPKFVG